MMRATNDRGFRILLVDDQPQVLSGLKRNLSMEEEDWTVVTAESGPQALELLSRDDYDLVVSDMRMPEMNGAELLSITREKHPKVIRFILSGYADQDLMLKASGVAHRYLTKPCDASEMIAAINETLLARSLIHNDAAATIVNAIEELHTDSAPIRELVATTANPDCDTDMLSDLIERHPTLHASVLHISNSSFFGASREVETLQDALQVLGVELTRSLGILELSRNGFAFSDYGKRCASKILKHCVATSFEIKRMDRLAAKPEIRKAVASAAMLHDLGKVALLALDEKALVGTCRTSLQTKRPAYEIEREVFGCDHAAVGSCLFELWGLPERLVQSVAWHHDPERLVGQSGFNEAALLYVADSLAHERLKSGYCYVPKADEALLSSFDN